MGGVMHEADHIYSIWSTWRLHRLATDVQIIHQYDLDCRILEF